jgi:hypothetical protein
MIACLTFSTALNNKAINNMIACLTFSTLCFCLCSQPCKGKSNDQSKGYWVVYAYNITNHSDTDSHFFLYFSE